MVQREFSIGQILPQELVDLYMTNSLVHNAFSSALYRELEQKDALIHVIKCLAMANEGMISSFADFLKNQPTSTLFSK